MKRFLAPTFLIVAGAFAASGCFATNAIDNALDCDDICDRYADCFDPTYDVGSCKSRCESDANDNEQFADRVELCTDCLDATSCTEAFTCASECSGIVP